MSANPLHDGNLTISVGGLNVTAYARDGSWSTSMPGGFGGCTFRLPGSLAGMWGPYNAAVVKGATVTVTHSGTTLFSGVVTNDLSHATIQGSEVFYEVTAAGLWWQAEQRKDFVRGYVDSDFTQWRKYKWSVSKYECSNDGSLLMFLAKNESMNANRKCGFYYWLHDGLCSSADEYIDHIEVMCTCDLGASWYSDWRYYSDNPWGSATLSRQLNNTTVSSAAPFRIPQTGSFPTTTKVVRCDFYPSIDQTTISRDLFVEYKKIRVYIGDSSRRHESTISNISVANPTVITTSAAHGLKTGDVVFIAGTSTTPQVSGYRTVTVTDTTHFTVPVNVTSGGSAGTVCGPLRVEEVMADAATSTGLASSDSVSQLTGAPNGAVQAVARPYTTVAEFLDEMAALSDEPFEYGFGTSSFFADDKTMPGGAAAGRFLIDASDPGIDYAIFKDSEYAYDYVRILYKFRDTEEGTSTIADGTVQSAYAYRSGASPTDPGWTNMSYRVYVYDASDVSMNEMQAEAVAQQVLEYLGRHVYRGTIKIATPTTPLYGGGTDLTPYIQAGDWIEASSAGTGLLYIGATDWDDKRATMTLTIGVDPEEFKPNLTLRPSVAGGGTLPGGPRLYTAPA